MSKQEWSRVNGKVETSKWIVVVAGVAALTVVTLLIVPKLHVVVTPVRLQENSSSSSGIYDRDSVDLGKSLGMTCIPGFSYEIMYDNFDAAVNGDSRHYVHLKGLSPTNVAIVQEQYVLAILGGLNAAIAKHPPEWVGGKSVGMLKPNYYPGGFARPIELTLIRDDFPCDPATGKGKALHDRIKELVKSHWADITDE